MGTGETHTKVADDLTRAFASRDAKGFERLYADDAKIWHAAFDKFQTKHENVGLLGAVFKVLRKAQYEEVKRIITDEGFVQYHVIRGEFTDGTAIPALNVAMIVEVKDGKIAYLREYFDASQFGEVWKRSGLA